MNNVHHVANNGLPKDDDGITSLERAVVELYVGDSVCMGDTRLSILKSNYSPHVNAFTQTHVIDQIAATVFNRPSVKKAITAAIKQRKKSNKFDRLRLMEESVELLETAKSVGDIKTARAILKDMHEFVDTREVEDEENVSDSIVEARQLFVRRAEEKRKEKAVNQ